jgi:hypothetical protein
MSFRSALYRYARLLGDIQAARRGPRAILMRLGRKAVLREVGKNLNKIR